MREKERESVSESTCMGERINVGKGAVNVGQGACLLLDEPMPQNGRWEE